MSGVVLKVVAAEAAIHFVTQVLQPVDFKWKIGDFETAGRPCLLIK